jgi:hypothetical protein
MTHNLRGLRKIRKARSPVEEILGNATILDFAAKYVIERHRANKGRPLLTERIVFLP